MNRYAQISVLLLALCVAAPAYATLGEGADCTKTPGHCARGLSCIGPDYRRRCKKLRQSAQSCGQDPYWVCGAGLTCEHNVCRINRGKECTDDQKWCVKGLQCVGTNDYKLCEKPIRVGGTCLIEPWWVCKHGLYCQHNKCVIGRGGECTNDPKWCAKGLQCVGTKYYKQCEKPIPAGGACLIEPWWVCAYGLNCEHNVCRIPRGGNCTKAPSACSKGLICVGTTYYKRCEKPVQFGEPCLIKPWLVCDKGLVCGGLGKARICIQGRDEGRPCRIGNPKMQCNAPLTCVKGFCRY